MPKEFAQSLFERCEYATLATINADATPYCVPLSVLLDGENVYFHGAQEGRKVDNLRRNPSVCISCVGETNIPPGQFTTEFESAVLFGTAEEITDNMEKIRILRLLSQKMTPGNMDRFDQAVESHLDATSVWKVSIEQITGKRKKFDQNGKPILCEYQGG